MRLIHNSRLPQFRTPFGAVTTGTSVSLSVILEDADPNQATLTLRTWIDEIGESLYPMTHEGDGIFTVELECTEPCLIWYSFICNIEGQPEVRLGAPQGRTGGEGVTYNYAEVPSFQITVYKHRENRPTWYERGMVYQIFPDRYARDENWRERTLAEVEKPRKGIQRRMVEDWNEPPEYERAEDGSIKTWDFTAARSRVSRMTCPALPSWALRPSTSTRFLRPRATTATTRPTIPRSTDSGHRAGLYRAVSGGRKARHFHHPGRCIQPHGRRFDLLQPLRQLPRRGRVAERGFAVARCVLFPRGRLVRLLVGRGQYARHQ